MSDSCNNPNVHVSLENVPLPFFDAKYNLVHDNNRRRIIQKIWDKYYKSDFFYRRICIYTYIHGRDRSLHRQIFSRFFFKGETWPDVISNEAPGRHWQTAIRAERMERIILPPTNDYLHVLILFSSSCLDDFTYKVFHARSTRLEKIIPDAISSKFSLCENFRFAFVHELLKKNTDQSRRTWLVSYVLSNAATRYARCDWPVFFSVSLEITLRNHRLILVIIR